MSWKSRQSDEDTTRFTQLPLCGPACECLAEFFREEFAKHHRCLEEQREYFSDIAITQAEDALSKVMGQLEQICRRDDACAVMEQVLKQLDVVTRLSAWTSPEQLH
jgi:hypothetical protein